MADSKLTLIPFPAPCRKRRNKDIVLDAHETLGDVLDVIRNVQDTLAAYQMMLTASEAAAIRALTKRGGR
jgi:hypothetical protein